MKVTQEILFDMTMKTVVIHTALRCSSHSFAVALMFFWVSVPYYKPR